MANQTASSTISLERFAPDAKSLVVGAQNLADERRHAEVLPLHLLSLALAKDPRVVEVFRRAGVDVPELSTALERALAALPRSNEPSYLAVATLELLDRAAREAERESRKDVRVEDLLNALTQEIRGRLGDVLTNFQLRPGSLRAHLSGFGALSSGAPLATGDSSTDALRSLLDASELNASPVIGRGAELRRVLSILERRSKCHPLLVGEPGVGKRSIVLALARRLAKGDVPTSLAGARLLELDSGALLAGARLRGEVEERTRQLLKRLQGGSDPTILFVRGLEQLFSSPGGGNAVGDLLHSTLERSELRLLGSTTADGLRKIQERDAPLLRLLTLLEVQEPSVEETKEIVRGVAGRFEQHHGVAIGESAIVSAAELAKRYVQDRSLPDSALDLLDESAARLRVEIDGVSPQADTQIRRLESLEAQLARARDVSDESGQRVRERLETELRERTPQVQALRQQLEARRGVVAAVRTLRAELQQAEQALALAREQKQFARVGELEHASLPELRSRIAK
ncbi:MAG TPA: AAA family ATPase, partial [Polyangiaceae bacterium]|nr:AAA family ATPase [Polyangiaceae bacterium]